MQLNRTTLLVVSLAATAICAGSVVALAQPMHNAPTKAIIQTANSRGVLSTSYSAVVSASGKLIRGDGATAASQPDGTGTFEVDFATNVTQCAYVATIGKTGSKGSEPAGFITVVGRSGNANGIYVETFAHNGKLKSASFHVDVGC
ncbi:MAG TPA: hypothetical protein VMF58_15885 [Rhizomicrobium sp.]|nr:hypothetical protein [Rhizomicrobium sp.]